MAIKLLGVWCLGILPPQALKNDPTRRLWFNYSSCLSLPRKHVLPGMFSFSSVSLPLRYSAAPFGEQNWSPLSQEKVLIISLQIFSPCDPEAMKVGVFHLCPMLKTISIRTLFLTSPPQGAQPCANGQDQSSRQLGQHLNWGVREDCGLQLHPTSLLLSHGL